MEKYEKPVMEVVEIENDAVLSTCASGQVVDTCAGGTLGFGGGCSDCDR